MRRRTSAIAAVALAVMAEPVAAQSESALRSYFEGKRVTLRMDMPGTSNGVDLYVDGSGTIDYREYGNRLKEYGTAIRSGESTVVTLVKVKKDLIEFQLGGGGFGTFGDDTSTSVNIPHIEKSSREKDLEKKIEEESDRKRRRELQNELSEMRERRERENRRIDFERERAEERKRERIAEQRLRGGSRFNIRYNGSVPAGVRPEEVIAALAEYVDFGDGPSRPAPARPAVADVGLWKGMSRYDVERTLGDPLSASDRHEGTFVVTTLVFVDGNVRITAEVVEDVLVRYTISSK